MDARGFPLKLSLAGDLHKSEASHALSACENASILFWRRRRRIVLPIVRGKNAGTGIGGREREDKRNKFIARSSEN